MNLFDRMDRFDTHCGERLRCNFIGTTAAIIGGLALAGSSVASGVLANKGANAQANAVKDASAAAVAEQQRQYDLNRQDLAPWRNSGGAANSKLAYLMGVGPQYPGAQPTQPGQAGGGYAPQPQRDMSQYGGAGSRLAQYSMSPDREVMYDSGYQPDSSMVTAPSTDQGYNPADYGSLLKDFSAADFQNDPGYEFRLGEGSKALQRSAAAKGQLFSGGTLKDLTQYNQNFASNEYGNAYNRFNTNKLNRYNMLAGLSQGGQQAANNTVQAGTNAANNISNITLNAGEQIGNARASGYAGWSNAINSGVGGALSAYYLTKGSRG
jgi:hypothetical protein